MSRGEGRAVAGSSFTRTCQSSPYSSSLVSPTPACVAPPSELDLPVIVVNTYGRPPVSIYHCICHLFSAVIYSLMDNLVFDA